MLLNLSGPDERETVLVILAAIHLFLDEVDEAVAREREVASAQALMPQLCRLEKLRVLPGGSPPER